MPTDQRRTTTGRSRIIRHEGGWPGLPMLDYGTGSEAAAAGVTRRVLPADDAAFEVRYYEVEPGGHTRHEQHRHVHVVVVFRGRGRVRLGEEIEEIGFGDVVYVAPDTPHQFLNPYAEPFGFLCTVDRERDRPRPVSTPESTKG